MSAFWYTFSFFIYLQGFCLLTFLGAFLKNPFLCYTHTVYLWRKINFWVVLALFCKLWKTYYFAYICQLQFESNKFWNINVCSSVLSYMSAFWYTFSFFIYLQGFCLLTFLGAFLKNPFLCYTQLPIPFIREEDLCLGRIGTVLQTVKNICIILQISLNHRLN